ncbi:MAG TPA: flavodoxin-dependent (E)-4-hydroxy-3-methylbut-2-enyl-diphosphate synthase, partial [Syntrophomonadaceae bacterium]|nr:flavodoxin-dependent (E)-4-hydroxy-3-methylbut-2-enyl-diphosphate synthase [Syntrophomonadaceae bacterium]
MRKQTRVVQVGTVKIGGEEPVRVQSMTNTDTRDITATVKQIQRLQAAGCELVRLAVVDQEAARALKKIKAQVDIPLIADIHFDHRLAIASIKAG